MQMDMIGIITDQIDDMKRFYVDALGLRIVEDLGKYVEFEGASIRFAICERQVMSETIGDSSYDQTHTGHAFELAFKCDTVADVDQAFQDLVEKGARPIKPPSTMPWGHHTGSQSAACLFLPPRKVNGKPDTRQLQPHFGITIDGDGEICTISDELGRPIDSADLLPVLARLLIAAELLLATETAATIVLEEDTPARALDAIVAAGGRVVLSGPSRQAMDTAMRDHDAVLGGGSSGRFWFRGPTPTADALVLLTHLLRILSQSDRPVSEVMRSE